MFFGAMNLQKWELFSCSPGISKLMDFLQANLLLYVVAQASVRDAFEIGIFFIP